MSYNPTSNWWFRGPLGGFSLSEDDIWMLGFTFTPRHVCHMRCQVFFLTLMMQGLDLGMIWWKEIGIAIYMNDT